MAHASDVSKQDGAPYRPLRVIDVETTIRKREQGGIYFKERWGSWHVISHTWSAGIRKLSEAVGLKIVEAAAGAGGMSCSYEEVFERGDLSREKSYWDLIEFLGMLKSDGVRWAWFDALCINQKDEKEKEAEIEHMGAYYEGSLGCYVAQHGLGMGFRVLDEFSGRAATDAVLCQYIRRDCEAYLPRWFTRAWTFQEWALPPKVTFIVEDLHMEQLNGLISIYEIHVNYPRIDRIPLRPIEGHQGRYFAEDKDYLQLLELYTSFTKVAYSDRIQLYNRMMLKFQRHLLKHQIMVNSGVDIHLIVSEISQRDASNEEDRVLSILKLLGVEGEFQVRTKKSLIEQIILLAQSLLQKQQQEILLQLCLTNEDGNDWPGMSWAPSLNMLKNHSWQRHSIRNLLFNGFDKDRVIESFHSAGTRIMEVSAGRGTLKMSTKVLQGELNISRSQITNRMIAELMIAGKPLNVPLTVPSPAVTSSDMFCIRIDHSETEGQGAAVWKGQDIHEKLWCKLNSVSKFKVRVWLVRMGCAKLMRSTMRSTWKQFTYFLVCIDDNMTPSTSNGRDMTSSLLLHKIGYFALPTGNVVNLIHSTPTSNVIVGGFGHDLNPYVLQS